MKGSLAETVNRANLVTEIGAESHLTRRLFGSMVRRIEALAVATG